MGGGTGLAQSITATLLRMANGGFHQYDGSLVPLLNWMSGLPSDTILFFFKMDLPIITEIWQQVLDLFENQVAESRMQSLSPIEAAQRTEFFRTLIKAGLQNRLTDRRGASMLSLAIHLDCTDLIQLLLDYGVSTDSDWCYTCRMELPPLGCAANENNPAALRLLMPHKGISENDSEPPALDWIVRLAWEGVKFSSGFISTLVAAGADPDAPFRTTIRSRQADAPVFAPTILDAAFFGNLELFHSLVPYSRLFGNSVTACGLADAANGGVVSVLSYLATRPRPIGHQHQRMLQFALVSSLDPPSSP